MTEIAAAAEAVAAAQVPEGEKEEVVLSPSVTPPSSPAPPQQQFPAGALVGTTFEDGTKFAVPKLWGPISGLLQPQKWCFFEWVSHLSILNLLLIWLPISGVAKAAWFFLWRIAYNLGIGIMLRTQSNNRTWTKLAEKIMTSEKDSKWRPFFKYAVTRSLGDGFDFDSFPASFNAWIIWRYTVDIILDNDFIAYIAFALSEFNMPDKLTGTVLLGYLVGVLLCLFALWAKSDSYRVVKDFAWYWGDFFFLLDGNLSFDRVFQIAPHPMYSIGYLWYYGSALITRSYVVLYVSLVAHFGQMLFLAFFETPHMKKIYPELIGDQEEKKRQMLEATGFFGKDLRWFKNFNPLRFSDIALFVVVLQSLLYHFTLPDNEYTRTTFILEAVFWRVMQSAVLGVILHKQSTKGWFVQAFTDRGMTKHQAFDHWKGLFNLVHTMSYVSFVLCAWKLGTVSGDTAYYSRQTIGVILVAISVWCYVESYEVLGDYGWFYGDFFIHDENVPTSLSYTGLYRFMDNPDSIVGYAGFYGVALFAESRVMLFIALFSQIANFCFVTLVERPHMRRLHGEQLRKTSGISSAVKDILKDMIEKNPKLRELNEKAQVEIDKAKAKIMEEYKEFVDEKIKTKIRNWKPEQLLQAFKKYRKEKSS